MRNQFIVHCFAVFFAVMFFEGPAQAAGSAMIGVRGGVGTDINLGIAYGLGVNFLREVPPHRFELGALLFGGSFSETSDAGRHTYEETTDLFVFGLVAEYLIDYVPRRPGLFFVTGIGLASITVEWEERSDTDESLGPLLPGGGSMQSDDGTAGGTVFILGFGRNFGNGIDIRLELPVILTFAPPGGASSVVPTIIATVGYRFGGGPETE